MAWIMPIVVVKRHWEYVRILSSCPSLARPYQWWPLKKPAHLIADLQCRLKSLVKRLYRAKPGVLYSDSWCQGLHTAVKGMFGGCKLFSQRHTFLLELPSHLFFIFRKGDQDFANLISKEHTGIYPDRQSKSRTWSRTSCGVETATKGVQLLFLFVWWGTVKMSGPRRGRRHYGVWLRVTKEEFCPEFLHPAFWMRLAFPMEPWLFGEALKIQEVLSVSMHCLALHWTENPWFPASVELLSPGALLFTSAS